MDRTARNGLSAPWRAYAIFGLLAAIGVAAVLFSTTWGIGLTPDSLTYVGAARNLLAGNGLSSSTSTGNLQPMVMYPPLFPLLIAATGLFGDPLEGARYLNALIFGANIFMVGLLIYRYTGRSIGAGVFGAVLMLTSDAMLSVHSRAISEPVYILSVLVALLLLSSYLDCPKQSYLLMSAGAAAFALLSRYVGVVLVLTTLSGICLLGKMRSRKKLVDGVTLLVVSGFPLLLWIIRNAYLTGETTGRQWVLHPITWAQLRIGLNTVSDWLLPSQIFQETVRFTVLGICVTALLTLTLLSYREKTRLDNRERPSEGYVNGLKLFMIFLITYVGFLLVYISLGSVDTPLDSRILSPAFVAVLILTVWYVHKLKAAFPGRKRIVIAITVLSALFVLSYLGRGATRVILNHTNGIGYASKVWKQSVLVQRVRDLPAEVPVYSNGSDVLYLLTERPIHGLPIKVNPVTGELNTTYIGQVAAMGERLRTENGVLAYFDRITWRWYLPSEEELIELLPLKKVVEAQDGSIYRIKD